MTDSKSFDNILISIENLNEKEQDALLSVLDKDKIDRNEYFSYSKVNQWCFIICSSIWFVALLFGGLLDVDPLWFRIILLPLFGLPFIILHVYQIINYRAKKNFVEFLAISLFIGPLLGFFWGMVLSFIIFYGWKFISHLMG